MTENEKKTKERNFEKTALILAVLLGMTHKSYEELAKDQTALDEITSKIHQNKSLMKAIESDEPLSEAQVEKLKKTAAKTVNITSNYMRVETANDERVCEKCRPWQGKIICVDGTDSRYPSLDDYMSAGCFHINCKCRLEPIKISENHISISDLVFN